MSEIQWKKNRATVGNLTLEVRNMGGAWIARWRWIVYRGNRRKPIVEGYELHRSVAKDQAEIAALRTSTKVTT